MVAAPQKAIIDKVEGITRISRGWVVLAYAHSAFGKSQLGLFSWSGFRLLDGADTALAQFTRDEPECGEKIMKAEMELAVMRRPTQRKAARLSAHYAGDVDGDASRAPSLRSKQHANPPTTDHHVHLGSLG